MNIHEYQAKSLLSKYGVVVPRGGVAYTAGEAGEDAAGTPEKILRVAIDPATGLQAFHAREIAFGLGLEGKQVAVATKFITALYAAFMDLDCAIVEINPLVVTGAGAIICLDAKV